METTKRPVVTHNATKVKALLFLQMRKQAGYQFTTAREIAIAINGNARSLYVLLERWLRWDLVIRFEGPPFTYCIDTEGERFLSKIGNWFFSGYYSKKRKRRVLGYRGNEAKLQLEIAVAANAVHYVYDKGRKELFYFTAPFNKASNFVREPMGTHYKRWGKEYLLLQHHENLPDAYNAIAAIWGLHAINRMGEAVVNAGLVQWKQN